MIDLHVISTRKDLHPYARTLDPKHLTMVIVAHHFLVRLQTRLNQREGAHKQPASLSPRSASS